MSNLENNPLLKIFETELIPYDKIKNEHYLSAFEKIVKDANLEYDKIIKGELSFTINNFEKISDLFDQIKIIYNNKRRLNSLDEENLKKKEIDSLISDFESNIYMNKELYSKFKEIDINNLTKEEKSAYNTHMRKFLENGMNISNEETKFKRLKEINLEITHLISDYENNMIKDEAELHINITDENDIKEMPKTIKEMAKKVSKEKGYENGFCFTIQPPSYRSIMMYCNNREIRKKMFLLNGSKCYTTKNCNIDIMKKILELRKEKAKLLGFDTFADFILSNRMAKNEKNIYDLLYQIREKSLITGKKDYDTLFSFVKNYNEKNNIKIENFTELERWDILYYSEKMKEELFGINSEDLRKYFPLKKTIEILSELLLNLYNIKIEKVENEHLYNEDVLLFKFIENEKVIGYFYMDLYPRKGKNSGGWVYALKPKIINKIPIVGINYNCRRPNENEEPTLSLEESEGVFHECGHAMHIFLSECKYKSISGLNVLWDFVECPSQFMENFFYEKETLKKFNLNDDLIEKVQKMRFYLDSFFELNYINACFIDLKIHSNDFNNDSDIEKVEKEVSVNVFKRPDGISRSLSFNHLFNATYDYSVGYYSYIWAEILAFDIYEEFKKGNQKDVAKKFRECILSKGGSDDPNVLFENFKGKKYSIEPFLKAKGLD